MSQTSASEHKLQAVARLIEAMFVDFINSCLYFIHSCPYSDRDSGRAMSASLSACALVLFIYVFLFVFSGFFC